MLKANILYEDYAVSVVSSHLTHLTSLIDGLREGQKIEYLHQWRVTSRRLRDALKVFKDVFPKQDRKQWNSNLRQLAEIAGPLRDLDVLALFLDDYLKTVQASSDKKEVETLLAILRQQRKFGWPALVDALERFLKTQTLEEIKKVLDGISDVEEKKDERYLARVAQKRIEKRLVKLLSFEAFVHNPAQTKELHQLRIAAKHLRYCLESFDPFYGVSARRFTDGVLSIQRVLGDWHDYGVWAKKLRELEQQSPDKNFQESISFLGQKCQKLCERAYQDFVKIWDTHLKNAVCNQLRQVIQPKEK